MDNKMYDLYKSILMYGGRNTSQKPQWKTLEHNGPMFPPEYVPHKIPVLINKKEYILPPLSEEYATLYSKYIGTAYTENKTFNKNFWIDFKETLPKSLTDKITKLDDIDFSKISNYLIEQSIVRKNVSKEEKLKIKEKNDKLEEKYKYCKIDGVLQQVGNFKIEPPGIFLGRGTHPKIGRIKRRINPEDVTINISKNVLVPIPNIKNHNWKEVIHDNKLIWLASWKDTINEKTKYVFTNSESIFKAKSDEEKFNLARKLKKNIKTIRSKYTLQLESNDYKIKQLATAVYLIDNLALRIGNYKNTDKLADTVGVTSLRVEHIKLKNNNSITLDFLSKDSIRYYKTVSVSNIVYNNISVFMNKKNPTDKLFDFINPIMLNEYLHEYMKGLTSKVWRTYNASNYFQNELNSVKNSVLDKMNTNEKTNYLISIFNKANATVASLCNHQKSSSTTNSNSLEKIEEQIKKLKEKKKDTNDENKINTINNKLIVLNLKKEVKNKTNSISLGTSKNNYIDPRIFFAYAKKHDIPVNKIINATLLRRFKWANKVDKHYVF